MNTLAQLTDSDRRTYRQILSEPTVKDLRREKVQSLLHTLGHVTEVPTGELHITRNGHVLALPNAETNQVETTRALLTLRKFLKRSEIPPHSSNGREAHLLLVIGHRQARVFRSVVVGGAVEQLMDSSYRDLFHHIDSGSVEPSELGAAFEPIVEALRVTDNILVFGESSSTQKEMDQFVTWLKQRHPELAERIIGSMVLDHDQVTSGVLLAKAREYYACARLYPRRW